METFNPTPLTYSGSFEEILSKHLSMSSYTPNSRTQRLIVDSHDYSADTVGIGSVGPYDSQISDSYPIIEKSWKDKLKMPIRKPKGFSASKLAYPETEYKDFYNVDECLKCFDELIEKNIGNIYVSGSVALFLQNRITRTVFRDLDVVVSGEYTLDDDMYDRKRGFYPPDPNGTELKSIVFNEVKVDFFSKIDKVNFVEIVYNNKVYQCQSYIDIINAKLSIVLNNMKDYEELKQTSFNIEYK